MINVVYLVLVFSGSQTGSAAVSIPQANMKQCQVNAKNYLEDKMIGVVASRAYCIVGVK